MQVLLLRKYDRDSLDLKFYRIDRNYRVSYARGRDHEEFLEDLAREKKEKTFLDDHEQVYSELERRH